MLTTLRIAVRSLTRSPAHTLAVVVTMALGVGAAATFYSMIAQALFPRVAYPEPERLVRIELSNPKMPSSQAPFLLKYFAYREAKSFAAVAGASYEAVNLLVDDEPQGLFAARVTDNFFALLGVQPALGRTFLPEETQPNAAKVVVLSDWFWRNRLGADPRVLERELKVNGHPHRIVGVLPRDFTPPVVVPGERSVFLPYALPAAAGNAEAFLPIVTLARLAPGVTPEQTRAELETLHPEQGKPYEKFIRDYRVRVTTAMEPPDNVWVHRYHRMLWISLGAVGFLYAIATVNAGSLVLVRMLGRRREIGVRLALGARRRDVLRPLLAEGLLMSVLAVGLGAMIAKWLMPLLLTLAPGGRDGAVAQLSGEGLAFLAVVGTLTTLAVVIMPGWHTTRLSIQDVVKDGSAAAGESRATRRLRGALVVIEAALAVVLLTGAGLMVRSFAHMARQKPGYELEHRYTVMLSRPMRERPSAEQLIEQRRVLLERVRSIPGVASAALSMGAVPSYYAPQKTKIFGREDSPEIEAAGNPCSPELLEALGIPLRLGRPLSAQRPSDPPAIWINETMARLFFGDRNPVGERVVGFDQKPWEIAGVVGDQIAQRDGAKPRFFFPYWQSPYWAADEVLLKLSGAPGPKFEAQVRRALYEVAPTVAVIGLYPLEQHRKWEVNNERLAFALLQVLSALALLLAATGLFAMMAYSVAQRRAEFGVRLALGAMGTSLYRLVLSAGAGLAALGVAIGLAAAWALSRFLESLLIGTPSHDALTFAAVGLLMLVVALLACWWPAQRAARVDVTELLRAE
ncbi:ADOP family duplicated permease [Oleiharenicola sp. Vm1]|uniref:ADOP family duplicated permease n=1 Tax=Oleiharenicola sp. Vm1 TaxID=3398393 RepID=UPI0039F64822